MFTQIEKPTPWGKHSRKAIWTRKNWNEVSSISVRNRSFHCIYSCTALLHSRFSFVTTWSNYWRAVVSLWVKNEQQGIMYGIKGLWRRPKQSRRLWYMENAMNDEPEKESWRVILVETWHIVSEKPKGVEFGVTKLQKC